MMASILDFIARIKARDNVFSGHVLEVGSFNVNGSPRPLFSDALTYLGIDLAGGPGVDIVMDACDLSTAWPSVAFDTALCCETLEHCLRPWIVLDEMKRVLRPRGYLWISTPTFGFPLHRFPLDCYRFGEDAYRGWMFAGMELLALEHVADELGQPAIVAVGRQIVASPRVAEVDPDTA